MFVVEINDIKQANRDEVYAVQQKSLEILLYYKDFCEKYGLSFFLCGGCCIGAIRHQGFIPWDDDIDVFMPREDYEKLAELWPVYAGTSRYSYCRTTQKENYHDTGASIRDNETTFINRHSEEEDIHQGLMLDIIPLDGCPDSPWLRLKQVFFALLYSLFNAQRLPDHQGRLIRGLAKMIFVLCPFKNVRYIIWKFAENKMTAYKINDCSCITELASGLRYMKNKYPKWVFSEAAYKEFSGVLLPVPIGYDVYLTMAFGDYMELPPVEDRIAKHNTVYINLEQCYKNFKGKYYCKSRVK